jgi:hypothetical protein
LRLIDPGDAKTFQRLDRLGRVVNDTLDSVDQFQRLIVAVLQGLGGLAPAAIEDRIRRRDPRRGGGVFRAHDADQNIDRRPGMGPRHQTDSVMELGI